MLKISVSSVKARLFDLSCSSVLEEYSGFWSYQSEEGFGISDHVAGRTTYICIFVNYDFYNGIVESIELINSSDSASGLKQSYLEENPSEKITIMNKIKSLFPNTKIIYVPSIDEEDEVEYHDYYEDEEDEDEMTYNRDEEDEEDEENEIDYAALGLAYILKNGY